MRLLKNFLCVALALLALLFCSSCNQSISDQGGIASEETTVGTIVASDDNSQVLESAPPINTNEDEQGANVTTASPYGEPTSPSQQPAPEPAPGAISDEPNDTPAGASENEPDGAAIPTPSSATESPLTSPVSETPEASSAGETPVPSPTLLPTTTPTTTAPPPPADDEPIALTIRGDGVSGETTWSLSQLQELRDGYRENIYSTTNNWPSYNHTSAHGVSLPYLLQQAGMLNSAASFKFTATDGYYFTVTYSQIFGTLYSYTAHGTTGSSGASVIEPIIAWEFGDIGRERAESLRVFFGQSGPQEVNTSAFVSNLNLIEVSSIPQGEWTAPEVSIADGSVVSNGTELDLMHDNLDSIRIYYTLDGSEPDYNSLVYNRSASYFQPQLTTPILLTEDVTIKAFAAGLGKDPSPVVTFSYMVSK